MGKRRNGRISFVFWGIISFLSVISVARAAGEMGEGETALAEKDCAGIGDPHARAQCYGLHGAPTPYVPTPYSPFVRLIRDNGGSPLEVRSCLQAQVIAGAGVTHWVAGRAYEANPYPYSGFEMVYGPDRYDEYIEAGLGYTAGKNGSPGYFSPYFRRAPDELEVGSFEPPKGFMHAKRGGKPLPGYWTAQTQPDLMMAEDGEFCSDFSFDSATNLYHFEFRISKTLAGTPTHGVLEMPSARWLRRSQPARQSAIVDFSSRLLTSVAITNDDFDATNSAYRDLVFGATWKASVRDSAHPELGWVPYDSDRFQVVNSDPRGKVIYYSLLPLTGPLEWGALLYEKDLSL